MGETIGLLAVIFGFIFVMTTVKQSHKERLAGLHGRRRSGRGAPASEAQVEPDVDYARVADRLDARVRALEAILDAEAPGWRKLDHD